MVSIDTNTISLIRTVVFYAGWAVLVLHALSAPALIDIAHQASRTGRVIFTRSPGVPRGLLTLGLDILCDYLLGRGHAGDYEKHEHQAHLVLLPISYC